tara:strand:- start:122 stop:352 length:231 start_codon:yes stop_codon:yes gene_type:complete
MENQILKGKVTKVVSDGKWTDFNKFKVEIENSNKELGEFNFLARGEFKKQIGDDIEFIIKNEMYKSAKIYYKPLDI